MKTQVNPSARLRRRSDRFNRPIANGGVGSGNFVVDQSGVALFTSAASAISVGAGQSSTFSVGGGGSGAQFVGYKASSSNIQVATVSVSGTSLTINGIAVGAAIVNVTGSAGANVVINVTVPTSGSGAQTRGLAAPPAVTLAPANTAQYNITGGTRPNTAVSSNPNIAAVAAGASAVSVTAANSGSATVVVFDSKGASAQFSLNVSGANTSVALYSTAPDNVDLGTNATASYQIAGGVAPYTVTSSYTDIATATVLGSTLSLQSKSVAGKGTINIVDSVGARVSFTANVNGLGPVALHTTAPGTLSINVGPAPTYQIFGGIGPYQVASSNPGVAKASIDGTTLNITGLTSGAAQVAVFDSTGTSVATSVTVAGGSGSVPLYTTAPDSITVQVGAAPTYTIAGAAPYVVTSSDVTVATVSQTDNTYTMKGVAAGIAQVATQTPTAA